MDTQTLKCWKCAKPNELPKRYVLAQDHFRCDYCKERNRIELRFVAVRPE